MFSFAALSKENGLRAEVRISEQWIVGSIELGCDGFRDFVDDVLSAAFAVFCGLVHISADSWSAEAALANEFLRGHDFLLSFSEDGVEISGINPSKTATTSMKSVDSRLNALACSRK